MREKVCVCVCGSYYSPCGVREGAFPIESHWSRELRRNDAMNYDDTTEELQTEGVARAKALGQKHAGAVKE